MEKKEKRWKSMNLPKEVYDFFMEEYEKHKVPLFIQGISSFSGYMAAVYRYAKGPFYRELQRKMRLQDDQMDVSSGTKAN